MRRVLTWILQFYQHGISPVIHSHAGPLAGCKFHPTCSRYAEQVIAQESNPLKAMWLITKRIFRCNPWSQGGVDLPPGSH